VQPLLGVHAELVAVLGEQLVVKAGVLTEFGVLAEQGEDVREGAAAVQNSRRTNKFSVSVPTGPSRERKPPLLTEPLSVFWQVGRPEPV
jgi:hypothetical protein